MTIGFEFCYCEHFTLTAYTYAGTEIDKGNFTCTLDTAIELAKDLLRIGDYEQVCATNRDTGEVIFIATAYSDCDEEPDFDCWDLEMGFNPYTGGYDYDC